MPASVAGGGTAIDAVGPVVVIHTCGSLPGPALIISSG